MNKWVGYYLYEPSPSIRNKQVNVIRVIISRMYTHSLRAFMSTDENIMGLALSALNIPVNAVT